MATITTPYGEPVDPKRADSDGDGRGALVLTDPDAWRRYTRARLHLSLGIAMIMPMGTVMVAWLEGPGFGGIFGFLFVLSVMVGSLGTTLTIMWARPPPAPGIYASGVEVVQTRLLTISVWLEFIRYEAVTAQPSWRGLELRTMASGDGWTVLRDLFGNDGLAFVARRVGDPTGPHPAPRLRVYPTGDPQYETATVHPLDGHGGPDKVL